MIGKRRYQPAKGTEVHAWNVSECTSAVVCRVNEPGMKWRLVERPDLKAEDARKMRWAWRSPLRPWNGKMRECEVVTVVEGGQSYCCLALLHSQYPAARAV